MQSKVNWGRILLSGASIAAMGAFGPAYAQDEGDVQETIVVTATGRTAAIQDVPLAVTAVSGEALENAGVTDLRDLQQLAPSYRFFTGQSNTAGTTAYIRGIGTGGDNPGFESAVGFFVDGVYRNRSGVALSDLPEVERIEVLRGPQGTLFGRNTTAGAISVVTAAPEFETGAWMSATAGDYDLISGSAGMTGALIEDVLAARLDISGTARDGFIEDVNSGTMINDRNRASARLQFLWDVSPDASFRFILDGAQTDEVCCGAVTLVSTGAIPTVINTIAGMNGVQGVISPPDPEARRMAVSPGRDYSESVDEWGASGQLNWDLGDVSLTSITAYRDWEAVRDQDIDFSGVDRAYRDDYLVSFQTGSQEVRLQGEFGRVDWLVGAYYSNEKLNLHETIRFGADAAEYIDFFGAGFAGVQLFGTFPMSFANIVGGTPGAQPNALGAVGLTGAARQVTGNPNLTTQQAFGVAATHPDAMVRAQLQGTYAALSNLLASTTPVAGEGQNDLWEVETTTMALFTHNEVALTDNLTLTLGARYNQEEKDLSASVDNIDLSAAPTACQVFNASLLNPAPTSTDLAVLGLIGQLGALRPLVCSPAVNEQAIGDYEGDREDNEWNGTASLAYNVNDDFMVYGAYSRGYKAGGYNLDRLGFNYAITGTTGTPDPTVAPSVDDLEFDPEFVDSFELGWKWNNGLLTLNGAVFLEQITDYQLLAFTGFSFVTSNVEDVVSKGVEVDFTVRPFDGFSWQGGVAYTDAYYDSPATDGSETLPPGTPLSHAPEWSLTSALSYEHPIGDDLVALYYLDGRWNSEFRTQTFGRNPATDNDAYALFNGRVGIGAEDGGWSLEFWGRNLTDQFYYVGGFAVPEQTTSGTGNWAIYPAEPRTWGVTLRARY